MSYPYKVEYIHSEKERGKWYESKSSVDAWTMSKELEALLIEYHDKGYELINIVPITTSEMQNGGIGAKTDGLMVCFKKPSD